MSYLIKRVARRLAESTLQTMYEIAVEKMVERGFEPTSVKKIGGEIKFEVDKDELTGYEVEDIKADTLEEFMEKRIDGEVDQPRYKYDEDFDEDPESPADHHQMIEPGKYVDIDALRDWVRTTKINRDEDIQDALRYDVLKISVDLSGYWTSTLEREIDHIAFKVARKIYYVGKKPPTMTPEEWDDYTRNMKPEPGTFAKGEDWGDKGFPYGADYKYREGNKDTDEISDPAFLKGWVEGGWAGVKL
jgi:hypothetical protein